MSTVANSSFNRTLSAAAPARECGKGLVDRSAERTAADCSSLNPGKVAPVGSMSQTAVSMTKGVRPTHLASNPSPGSGTSFGARAMTAGRVDSLSLAGEAGEEGSGTGPTAAFCTARCVSVGSDGLVSRPCSVCRPLSVRSDVVSKRKYKALYAGAPSSTAKGSMICSAQDFWSAVRPQQSFKDRAWAICTTCSKWGCVAVCVVPSLKPPQRPACAAGACAFTS
mmetsp:Transcript_67260/g.112616  ORF Transcript_67260/g.112616 Transcript_67260/m.112616 type:complete len:224 (+) Transcript_67260:3038-3709(+)